MKTRRSNFPLWLALFWPVAGWAHALSPAFYPIGPMPMLILTEWWPYFVLIPVSISAEAFVLWVWARRSGVLGNLWRSVPLYIAARAGETLLLFSLQSVPLFHNAGWRSSAKDFYSLVLFLAGGLIFAVPVGFILYRGTELRTGVVAPAVCAASLAGYFAALACSLILVTIRGY